MKRDQLALDAWETILSLKNFCHLKSLHKDLKWQKFLSDKMQSLITNGPCTILQ